LRTETLTFLFTDIEGSTALLERVGGEVYGTVLAEHHRLIRDVISRNGGREVETQGDAFFVVFSSAAACVAAAAQIQAAIAERTWPGGNRVRVRMALHSGEASETSTGLVGLDIHRAARVAAVAWGGQILLSETAAALVRDSLQDGTWLRDLGLHRLKDLNRPARIFQLEVPGLNAEFPSLRSLDNPELASNLPAPSASFIGRDAELAGVRRLVASSRLVTLAGAGGCGKTRLALEVAGELLDGSREGVWLVDLAAVTEQEAVTSSVTGTLGITGQPGRRELETLLDVLGPQSLLIILDNCEHLISSCAALADAILTRCPKVRLLATSREPLGIAGESVYRVPSLSLPAEDGDDPAALGRSDAVALFLERARGHGVQLALDEQSGPLIASTCRRLDGMPLAIELAAARLRALSVSELHDLLDQRFRLLTGGSRAALERQQTLRATVEWSYGLLTEPERSLLRRLSVFVGGFDRRAAAAVYVSGEIDEFEIMDLLGSLVDKSLVVADQKAGGLRYRLLETIRQFAAEHLVELDEHEAARIGEAHVEYFLALVEEAAPGLTGPEPERWFAELDANYPNIQRAIERAAEEEDKTSVVLRFVLALAYYWFTRGRRRDAFGYVMPALERPQAELEPPLRVRALTVAASCALADDSRTMLGVAEQAAKEAALLSDEKLEAWATVTLAGARHFAGEAEAAYRLAKVALEQARLIGDDLLLAEAMLTTVACSRNIDPARADALHREAVAHAERSGNVLFGHDLHMHAGEGALEGDDLTTAREHLDRAAQVAQLVAPASWYVKVPLGLLLRAEGQHDEAIAMLRDTVRATYRVGDRMRLAYSVLGIACVAADRSEWKRAAELHGAADGVHERIGPTWLRYDFQRRASMQRVRESIGDAEFEHAYSTGHGLGLDAAVGLALSESRVGAVGTR
jgi:predicted ATPase/class 3 adenylate cyclase